MQSTDGVADSFFRVDQLVERTNELDFQRKQLEADNKKLDSHRLKQKEQLEEELTHYWTQVCFVTVEYY